MLPFLNAPPEIIACLMKNCGSFKLLKALIFTCKKFNGVWKEYQSSIIWDVGRADLLAFNDALMAVRATEIVKKAVVNNRLPPNPFPVTELDGQPGRYPSAYELKLILDFQHFASYFEIWKSPCFSWADFYELPQLNSADLKQYRRRRLYSALYRVLLAGAVLYGAYNGPIVRGETQGPSDFLKALKKFVAVWRSDDRDFNDELFSDSDVEYLKSCPVYNHEDHEGKAADFAGLAELFVKEGRIRLRDEGPIGNRTVSSQETPIIDELTPLQSIILHETGQFAYAFEWLTNLSSFYTTLDGKWTSLVWEQPEDEDAAELSRKCSVDPIYGWRTVSVVLFGIFRLEKLSMPPAIVRPLPPSVLEQIPLVISPLNPDFPSFQELGKVLSEFHAYSVQADGYNPTFPTPYPPLDFVEFIFRRYLGLRFADVAFSFRRVDSPNPYEHQIREIPGPFLEPWHSDALVEYDNYPRERYIDSP